MKIKPIKTNKDYKAALRQIDLLFDAVPGTAEGDMLDILVTLVEKWEESQFPILYPDPISAIKARMEALGMEKTDLMPLIGGRSRVYEILTGKRSLSLKMIRRISEAMGISGDILIRCRAS